MQLWHHSIASSFLLDRTRPRKPLENTCPRDSLRLDCKQIRDLRPIAASLLKSHPRNTFSTPVVALTTWCCWNAIGRVSSGSPLATPSVLGLATQLNAIGWGTHQWLSISGYLWMGVHPRSHADPFADAIACSPYCFHPKPFVPIPFDCFLLTVVPKRTIVHHAKRNYRGTNSHFWKKY